MSNILSYANISVEVLNDYCWEKCEDFDPWLKATTYATAGYDTCIYTRHFECRNLEKCKRLSLYLERNEG